jgi:cytochrome c oxidase subunit II
MDTRDEFGDLFSLYLPVMAVATAIVLAAVVFAVLRYRSRPGREPSRRVEAPKAEAAYALVLAVIAAVLVGATFRTESRVDTVPEHPQLRIAVTAFQWGWRFDYAGGATVYGTHRRQPVLVVPARTEILFELTSQDVIHAFWVPALRFKRDAFPRRTTRFGLLFPEEGRLSGTCAEFCGLEHTDMTFDIRVLAPAAFRTWLRGRAG